MLRVPTALLLHQTPRGRHHDWLIATPGYLTDPGSGLWTARVTAPSRCWRERGLIDLDEAPPHRRAYLDYQGPISAGRGRVVRIDRGSVVVRLWRSDRAVWDVCMRHFVGRVEVVRINGPVWRARVVA
jgi:hypothetical protein